MRRLAWWLALGATVSLIVLLTLTPGSPLPYRFVAEAVRPLAGPRQVAAVLNILLFVPLGALLGLLRRPWLLLGAVAVSVAIELTQTTIDGRNPDPWDLAMNVTGACLGYLAVTAGRRWQQARGHKPVDTV